jgi:hypothetical protein
MLTGAAVAWHAGGFWLIVVSNADCAAAVAWQEGSLD